MRLSFFSALAASALTGDLMLAQALKMSHSHALAPEMTLPEIDNIATGAVAKGMSFAELEDWGADQDVDDYNLAELEDLDDQ